jgi:hypothetical protein
MCERYGVVNFKQYGSVRALDQAFGPRWVYIGRANPRAGLAQSALANPFKVKDFGGQLGATLPPRSGPIPALAVAANPGW